jgi:sugar/nucleoside kinase (ribokinase family)
MNEPILIVGSTALDSVKTPFGEHENILGGSAIHSSIAASFFSEVRLVGVIGDDFPKEHIELLHNKKIDTKGLQVIEGGKTFHWKGYYEYDMNQAHTLDTQLNVFADFDPQIPEEYKDTPYVFLANIDPELQLKVLDQVRDPKLVLVDTMNFWIESKREKLMEVLFRADVVLMNEGEIRQLMDKPSILSASRALKNKGVKTLIIKKGEHGVLMLHDDKIFAAPSYPIETVKDTTGAGDSFAGGLLGYIAYTDDLSDDNFRKAIMLGSTMASYIVEDFSCNRFISLNKDDITDRYMDFKKLCDFETVKL